MAQFMFAYLFLGQLFQLFPSRHGSVCVYMFVLRPVFFNFFQKGVVQFMNTCLSWGQLFYPSLTGMVQFVYTCLFFG